MSRIILVVEDQADIRKLISMTLELDDYEIHEAVNGVTGLRMAQALRPDVVLLDIMMPGELDGLEACARIKADPELRHTRVVLLTAHAQQVDREAGKQAGCDAYLTKPFSPLELIEAVAALVPAG